MAMISSTKTPRALSRATVKWFNAKKGFGFLLDPKVPGDIFVHFSVIQADGFRTLDEGDQVEYELVQDEKGSRAGFVVRI
jgi:CspA family cold shock protein